MKAVYIADLKINPLTKNQLISELKVRLTNKEKTWITTAYSEFLYQSLRSKDTLRLLNSSDITVADGVGIKYAEHFLKKPLQSQNHALRILGGVSQAVSSLFTFRFDKDSSIPEAISGANLIYDICQLAEQENKSIYLLGGFGETPLKTKKVLEKKYPRLNIVGLYNGDPENETLIQGMKSLKPDIVFVALGPMKQENWIQRHKDKLSTTIYIGLGGTFDYIAGVRPRAPEYIQSLGLEWLYRLITQPKRIKRITQATLGLMIALLRYKVWSAYPLRPGVVVVILNQNNQVFVGKRLDVEGYWQYPQGGMEQDETLETTAKREAYEETGMVSLQFLETLTDETEYNFVNGKRSLFKNDVSGFRGQHHRFVIFRFTGDEKEVNLQASPTPEFSEYKWVDIHTLPQVIGQLKSEHTKIILNGLSKLL